jgi:methylase of polypeptide subunit release factors
VNYRLAYALGFHPWEDLAEHPPFADKLLELVAREEDGHEPPYGPALDLGTGSAVWGVRLAQRGWDVTGIDIVDKALRRARERADEAGVEIRLVQGDVTSLSRTEAGSGR